MAWTHDPERNFRKQFRIEGGQLVFRRNAQAAPVQVTKEEMDEAVRLFLKRHRIIYWASIGILTLAIVTFAVFYDHPLETSGPYWLLLLGWLAIFLAAFRWAWRSPTAAWSARIPVGVARSRSEVRAEMLADWSWLKLLAFLVLGTWLVVVRIIDWPPTSYGDWIWLVTGALIAVMSALNCIMKWRTSRSNNAQS